MAKKMFKVLENNPEVMNHLGAALGMAPTLSFHDIYSLTDPDLLSFIPRPAYALLVIIPLTPTWHAARENEDARKSDYEGKGETEPVIWFKQTIGNACGSIGLVHCLLNSGAAAHIVPGSTLARIRDEALPKGMWERAKVLEESERAERERQENASKERSEDEIVMEYIKKQSLMEEEHRRRNLQGRDFGKDSSGASGSGLAGF